MIGMLAGLASSIAGAGVSTAISNANAERANKVQRDMQRDSMMFNKFQSDLAYERGTLASRIRQMRNAGFSPSLALDFSQQVSPATSSVPSAHQANQPNVDFTPFTSAVSEFENREFQGDLQRAQVLATLNQADLTKEQKDKVNAEILDIFDNMNDRRIRTYDNHLFQTAQINMIDSQIEDMKKQREIAEKQLDLSEREFEHKKMDDAEKNRIAEKVGTYNDKIKTFEYVRDLLSDFFDGSSSAQEVIDKVVSAPQSVFDYFQNLYGGLKKFIDSFNPGGSRHLDWSKYDKRSKGHSKVDRVHK